MGPAACLLLWPSGCLHAWPKQRSRAGVCSCRRSLFGTQVLSGVAAASATPLLANASLRPKAAGGRCAATALGANDGPPCAAPRARAAGRGSEPPAPDWPVLCWATDEAAGGLWHCAPFAPCRAAALRPGSGSRAARLCCWVAAACPARGAAAATAASLVVWFAAVRAAGLNEEKTTREPPHTRTSMPVRPSRNATSEARAPALAGTIARMALGVLNGKSLSAGTAGR